MNLMYASIYVGLFQTFIAEFFSSFSVHNL